MEPHGNTDPFGLFEDEEMPTSSPGQPEAATSAAARAFQSSDGAYPRQHDESQAAEGQGGSAAASAFASSSQHYSTTPSAQEKKIEELEEHIRMLQAEFQRRVTGHEWEREVQRVEGEKRLAEERERYD